MPKDRETSGSPARFFGSEVREARKRMGLSQPGLGALAGYDPSYVSKVENGAITPDEKFISACDEAFPDMHGWFSRFWHDSRKWDAPYPSWFKDWIDAERNARVLRWWEPILIPGLLQTADYARALFRAWQTAGNADDIERLVAARLDRQEIFDSPAPPEFIAVIDEAVFHRHIGSAQTMRGQLEHLIEVSMRPNISLNVVPAETGAHMGLLGAFIVAEFGDDPTRVAYLETPDEGLINGTPGLVTKILSTFERVRSEALPRGASRDLIRKVVNERWTP